MSSGDQEGGAELEESSSTVDDGHDIGHIGVKHRYEVMPLPPPINMVNEATQTPQRGKMLENATARIVRLASDDAHQEELLQLGIVSKA